jgi:hypothetical protein
LHGRIKCKNQKSKCKMKSQKAKKEKFKKGVAQLNAKIKSQNAK